nr:type II toxin-antitoxin system VapC family toxin [Azospirillum doebereinerae]
MVVDASVAIKWIIDEEGSPAALALRRHRLAAPDLWVAECANILWKKVRRGELSGDEAVLAARLLARAEVELAPMRSYLEAATAIAVALDHPAYDCVYLAMAEAAEMPFVTADERLLRKTRNVLGGRFAGLVLGLDEAASLQD